MDLLVAIGRAFQPFSSLTKCESDMMKRNTFVEGLVACAVVVGFLLAPDVAFTQSGPAAIATLKGDPVRGRTLHEGCIDCHFIDAEDVGPRHRGVVGRRAGIVKGYGYSLALKNSGLTWDEATLDRWLIDPSALVPGTKMLFKVDDAQDRADIIAYLKEKK